MNDTTADVIIWFFRILFSIACNGISETDNNELVMRIITILDLSGLFVSHRANLLPVGAVIALKFYLRLTANSQPSEF